MTTPIRRVSRLLPGVAALTTLTACGLGGDDVQADPPEVALDDQVAILSPDQAGALPGADWTPAVTDVLDAEELLEGHMEQASSKHPDLEDWSAYYRQYTGVDGDAIEVNALCEELPGWESSWILVADGGACFWQARVEDGEVTSFIVNGVA